MYVVCMNILKSFLNDQRGEISLEKPMDIREFLKIVVFALVFAGIIRSFLFEPFHIPSGSMKRTLLVGDYLFVSKYSYGYSRYSFPFGMIPFSGRIFQSNQPERGDIIVFRTPSDTRTDFIKRLIGLPGDRIQVKDGVLYINGVAVKREKAGEYIDNEGGDGEKILQIFRETLPNGVSYDTLDETKNGRLDNTGEYLVPKGHYFMMGDNRDNSQDSRVLDMVGYVPAENFIGKARIIFFSADPDIFRIWKIWAWPKALRNGRFFIVP